MARRVMPPRSRRSPMRDLPVPSSTRAEVLAGAVWHIDADAGPSGANLGTAAGLDATGAFATIPADAWAGTRLVGYAERDTDYDTDEGWFTDLDVSATFSVPPHADNNPDGRWAEMLHIPVDGGGNITEYVEFAVVFRDAGGLAVGVDFESGDETGGPYWTSDQGLADVNPPAVPYQLGDWSVGVPEVTVRLQIVAATGAVTLKVDGVTVCTDTIGECALTQPTDGDTVQVGGFTYVVPLAAVTLLDGIDGDPLIAWESGDAGWTVANGGSFDGAAPSAAWFFAGDGEVVTVADDPALDVAADASATWAFWFTQPNVADVDGEAFTLADRTAGNYGADADGFRLIDIKIAAFSADFAGALVGDGANFGFAVGAHWSAGPHLAVLVVDRDTDVATLYVDGASHATADISAVGAIDPAANLTLAVAAHHAAAKWDRALTAHERVRLNERGF